MYLAEQAVELVIGGDGPRALIGQADLQMVLEVFTHAWQCMKNLDAVLLQQGRRTDA